MAKESVKPGDKVHLVTAHGLHIEATIDKVGKDDKVDLTANPTGGKVVITSAPLDATGKLADSWHPIEA